MTRDEVETVMAVMAKMDAPAAPAAEGAMDGPVALKSGQLQDADRFHKGSGGATLYRLKDGSAVLRLEDFRVTNGPDLHVILTSHPAPSDRDDVHSGDYLDLGKLKGNVGNQNYPLPATADPSAFSSVVIYCSPFHVIFSVASLEQGSIGAERAACRLVYAGARTVCELYNTCRQVAPNKPHSICHMPEVALFRGFSPCMARQWPML